MEFGKTGGEEMKKLLIALFVIMAFTFLYAQDRSPQWRKVRAAHIAAEPQCAACGEEDGLEVHHIVPFNVDPALELDPDNLITLDRHCHYRLGHGGKNWKEGWPDVRDVLGGVSNSVGYKVRMWREGVAVSNAVTVTWMNDYPELPKDPFAIINPYPRWAFQFSTNLFEVELGARSDGVVVWREAEE